MEIDAAILMDSMSPHEVRLTTMELTYPRFIHAEFLRHRVFSHSVASSRAIPTERIIEQVLAEPFIPTTFNNRVKGMGVGTALEGSAALTCEKAWLHARDKNVQVAHVLMDQNVDKSRVNRLLEPFMFLTEIVTGTEWSNFFGLRDHGAAQPEFQVLAQCMRTEYNDSDQVELGFGEWHMPLVDYADEFAEASQTGQWGLFKRISASRVARVSYVRQHDVEPREDTLARATRLIDAVPPHLSPAEHVARPFHQEEWNVVRGMQSVIGGVLNAKPYPSQEQENVLLAMGRQTEFIGNLRGWVQMRKELPLEHDAGLAIAQAAVS